MIVPTVNVLGVRISVIDQQRAREILFDAVRNRRRGYVTVTGVHGVMEAQDDPRFRDILNNALLTTPDGMPMDGDFLDPLNLGSSELVSINQVVDIVEDIGGVKLKRT